jgi:hypothetical protein
MGIKSTAVGANGFSIKLIRFILCRIWPSSYPSIWKTAMVVPLPKISSTSVLLSDFRPISILSVLSKGERILYDQLVAYLESNSLLSQFQSGFRRCHSTVSALVKIIYDIQLGVEASVVILLDFSETFDSMSHDLLLRTERFVWIVYFGM